MRNGARLLIGMLGVLFGIIGCSQDDPIPPTLEVRVEHVPSARAFRVTYESPIEARALVFGRGKTSFRARNWKPQNPEHRIEFRDGKETLLALHPTRTFEIMVPEQFADNTGDYPLMSRFSVGGIVLYTGHLDATPITCFEVCSDDDVKGKSRVASQVHLTLIPSAGERVLADGDPSSSPLKVDPPAEGVFAYFGSLPVIKRSGYSVVMDPTVPGWILPELEQYFPQILDLDARRLSRPLGAPPVVFIPYRNTPGAPYAATYSGAVVGHQMLLSFYGDNWVRRTDEAREQFLKLLAHESFHFWNSSQVHSVDVAGGAWLHEGSADAFSYLSLLELGVVTAKRYSELQTEALNRCLVGLSGSDLPSSSQNLGFRNFYECGAVVQLLVSQASKRQGSSLWMTWTKLLKSADLKGGYYTHDDFFQVAETETGAPSLISSIRLLTSGSVKGTELDGASALESFFLGAFARVGITLTEDEGRWPSWYHRLVGERAIAAAIESDCEGEGYFIALGEKAKLIGGPSCRHLRGDSEIRSIGRFAIWKEGVQVYELIRKKCHPNATLEMAELTSGDRIRLMCPSLPVRPAFLRLPETLPAQ